MAIAALVVSAGCSSFLTDGSPPPEATATEGPAQQGTGSPSGSNTSNTSNTSTNLAANGTDIRSVTIPEAESGPNTYYGEIDEGDSVIEGTNQYYESILFAAESGDTINVTMSSIANDPELRLRNPSGTTVAIDDDGADGNNARFERLELNQTGQYTLVAAAAEPNTGFDYTLTVERSGDPDLEPEEYNERQRLLNFGSDYILYAQNLSGGRSRYVNLSEEEQLGNLSAVTNRSANITTDEVVVGYYMDGNATTDERIDIDVSLLQSYALMYQSYTADDGSPENASWVPDRIYNIARTYDGELYQVSYIERDWALQYAEQGGLDNATALNNYGILYYSTVLRGPGHPEYMADGGEYSVDPQDPLGPYLNESSEYNRSE